MRVLSDTDCISRSHQAREVIAFAHDVKIDVLAQVEAWVLVWAAEARHIEIEDDQRRATAAHRLKQSYPCLVCAWGDHGDGAARQPPDLVPCQRLSERSPTIGLSNGEIVENQPVLADRSVRLEDGSLRVVGDEPYL